MPGRETTHRLFVFALPCHRPMLFPIHSDRRLRSTPWVNYTLIGANVLIFLFTERAINAFSQGIMEGESFEALRSSLFIVNFYLYPDSGLINLWQFVTYQFLHNDIWHLGGNMIFLFVFGNHVEDRLGKVAYLCFYLAGGVLAGLTHVLTSEAPVLGASGAVAGVSGAYLAWFPLSNITLAFFFVFGSFEVSGMVLILFYIGMDLFLNFTGVVNIAYEAHLGGYFYGFALGLLLLRSRLLPREPYDMLSLLEQRQRKARFKRLTDKRGSFFSGDSAGGGSGEGVSSETPLSPEQQQVLEARAEIAKRLTDHNVSEAAARYVQLLEAHPNQALPQQQQLDVANHLMAEGRYGTAAAAYELFLDQHAGYHDLHQVQLILGLVYGRYLDQRPRARELLTQALANLTGADRQLAEQVLGELGQPT
ncbi:MAG: rhomboid family intramembrane serine protease [Planctomycetota bacterium]